MAENREVGTTNSRDEWAVTGGKVPALAAPRDEERRFGARLRDFFGEGSFNLGPERGKRIADAIDRDAATLLSPADQVDSLRAQKEGLRRKVEAAVDVLARWTLAKEPIKVVGVDLFRAELDRIFGDRPEAAKVPDLTVLPQLIGSDLWPVLMAKTDGKPRFLTHDEAAEIVRILHERER